jgi:hypothetical protein
MSDRCDMFPSMEKRFCSHCRGLARGTQQNPHFSIQESFFRGSPVVEIFKNGGPIHQHDQHFRFGCRIARMLLACLPAFKEFAWPSQDADRTHFKTRVFADQDLGVTIEVYVKMNPNFVRSTGELIDECWLELRALPSLETHKGLGAMKCKAVWSVQDELRIWLRRHCS